MPGKTGKNIEASWICGLCKKAFAFPIEKRIVVQTLVTNESGISTNMYLFPLCDKCYNKLLKGTETHSKAECIKCGKTVLEMTLSENIYFIVLEKEELKSANRVIYAHNSGILCKKCAEVFIHG
jgi:hypothetical protein